MTKYTPEFILRLAALSSGIRVLPIARSGATMPAATCSYVADEYDLGFILPSLKTGDGGSEHTIHLEFQTITSKGDIGPALQAGTDWYFQWSCMRSTYREMRNYLARANVNPHSWLQIHEGSFIIGISKAAPMYSQEYCEYLVCFLTIHRATVARLWKTYKSFYDRFGGIASATIREDRSRAMTES